MNYCHNCGQSQLFSHESMDGLCDICAHDFDKKEEEPDEDSPYDL